MQEMAGQPPPFRLESFGTLVLRGPEGCASPEDHIQQSRRLALLAVLAASGERGRSRDELLLLFWPEASQPRARHSLEQALYLIRKSVDAAVFRGVNPLRLNPTVISSDVADFERTLGESDLEKAVGLYQGPFLEGFYLDDSPEFEDWMLGKRARLEAGYTDALERLAEAAEARGDHQAAVDWWRKLADADPLSSRNALGLIGALANAGDHTAALRHVEQYERLVAKELDTTAGPAIASLAAEIRASVTLQTPPTRPPAPPPHSGDRESTREVSPPRERGEAQPVTISPPADRRMRKFVLYGVAAFCLVAAVLLANRLREEPTDAPAAEAGKPSIAVLPLSNLSADPRDAALADGMTEELIAMLAKAGEMRVIASTSVFAFRNRQIDVRGIADSLGVSSILEGGVRRAGSRLRVQIRLVEAGDGSTRWSETYDRELEDVFAVQEDIARAVARELGVRLAGSGDVQLRRRPTNSIAAYEYYLRGSDPALIRSESGIRRGVEYFDQAIAADSTYAAAYAGLARMYLGLSTRDDPGMPVRGLHELSEQAALKAVSLDDSLAEARATLGLIRLHTAYDFASAEAELKRAVDLDPTHSLTRQWLVNLYILTGRPEEALVEARRGLQIDPLSPSAHAEVAHALLANGRYDGALAQLEHIASVQPPLQRTAVIAAQAYAKKGMWDKAIAVYRTRAQEGSRSLALYGYLLAGAGRREEADRIAQTLIARWHDTGIGAFTVATVYAGLEDFDQAFAWLDRSIDDRSLMHSHIHVMEPIFEELRSDPRFGPLKKRMGLQNR